MNVNWQNLGVAIQNGQAAFEKVNSGMSVDPGEISFYDHPMSDLANAASLQSQLRPNDFIIGSSKWGGSDLVAR